MPFSRVLIALLVFVSGITLPVTRTLLCSMDSSSLEMQADHACCASEEGNDTTPDESTSDCGDACNCFHASSSTEAARTQAVVTSVSVPDVSLFAYTMLLPISPKGMHVSPYVNPQFRISIPLFIRHLALLN